MQILLSNDDGVYAPGLAALYKSLCKDHNVTVIAPDRDRSAASNSLTLSKPIRPHYLDNGFVSVDGTPTDCVHFGLTALLQQKPDMVVSGINAGANLGDDVLYSGTVAAATEGRFLGFPSIATSLVGDGNHYDSAAIVIKNIVNNIANNPLPANTILNVNIPDLPLNQLKGYQVTQLGRRHPSGAMLKSKDPRGLDIYWVGPAGAAQKEGPGTDFYAVNNGFVSITPLEFDMTNYKSIDALQQWSEYLLPITNFAENIC